MTARRDASVVEYTDTDAAITVTITSRQGVSPTDRRGRTLDTNDDSLLALAEALAAPGVAAKFLRMIGDGNPQVEGMADLLSPPTDGEPTPQQLGQQVQQMQQENQALTMLIQKMQQAMQAKLPEIEAKKWTAAIQAITSIRVAEINAGADQSAQDIQHLEKMAGIAHDAAKQAAEHEHAAGMADRQQQGALEQQQQAAELQPEPTGAEK